MKIIVDIAICLSFICFSIAFFIWQRKLFCRAESVVGKLWRGGFTIKSMNNWQLIILIAIPLIYIILLLYVRIVQTGSLEGALYGFYAIRRSNEAAWLARFLTPLSAFSFTSLMLLRMDAVAFRKRFVSILFFLLSLLMLLVLTTRGAKGSLILVAITILLADSLISVRTGRGSALRPAFFIIFAVAIVLSLMLTVMRGHSYDSFEDLTNEIAYNEINTFADEGTSNLMRGGSIGDQIAFCLKHYGQDISFRYFHTPYSLAVNMIPREFWSSKPIGFGKLLAEDQGFAPDNPTSFAAGLAGEGYANGGWLGIVVLSILIGILCGSASGIAYWCFLHGGVVHIVLGMAFWKVAIAFVRGDMLCGWKNVYSVVVLSMILFLINEYFITSRVGRVPSIRFSRSSSFLPFEKTTQNK